VEAVDDLRGWLEQVVTGGVSRVDRARLPEIGSYDCDAVTVELVDGTSRRFFLKDFSHSRQTKDHRGPRRDRELRVYRELLADSDLGTPGYRGSVWDESRDRHWLLLELVEGEVVKEVDVRHGVPAAAWLARMQAHFLRHADRLAAADYLIDHDAAYFRAKAEAARRDVAAIAPACAGLLDRALEAYDRAIDLMTSQPRSLVHGGFIPWHIMVDQRREPVRVCVLDWELAARGSTLFDLAYFTDGADPEVREPIVEAYRAAAARHDVPVPDDPARVMDCFRMQRVVDWLSRAVEKGFSPKKTTRLVTRMEALSAAAPGSP
jgi:aminoglycoside phosphotransferase (APT) family kinase protein